MTQNQPKLFSSGLESACLLTSSGLLSSLWKHISDASAEKNSKEKLLWKKFDESDFTVIAFVSTQHHVQRHLLPSSDPMVNLFQFLCSKNIPTFSLNRSAISLFNDYGSKLHELKSEIDLKKPLIVTGHAIGGSIASLFTLWLLDSVGTEDKTPLCITFGSPLIGDPKFQQAISGSSTWNSCFLHVASLQDPLPSSFTSIDSYKPFGIFLLCSDHGSACFEYPDSILMLLKEMRLMNQGLESHDYGNIVQNLNRKAICKDTSLNISPSNALQACLAWQLWALFAQLQNFDMKNLVENMEKQEVQLILKKRKQFDPSKKLNDSKINMANLEWYKKISKNQKTGYYDSFKNDRFQSDQFVILFIRTLNNYWKDMVAEVEKRPQKEGAAFRTRWLYAGTNYRRMVEPLDIAQYYKDGGEDYVNRGRSEHYKQLEKWLELEDKNKPESMSEEKKKEDESKRKRNVESLLTIDSCFWAHVEEALISCRKLKAVGSSVAEKQEARERLVMFEDYVYELLKSYAVSPEIFLKESSYMIWWNEYNIIVGTSHDSRLANFMRNPANRKQYEEGVHVFPK